MKIKRTHRSSLQNAVVKSGGIVMIEGAVIDYDQKQRKWLLNGAVPAYPGRKSNGTLSDLSQCLKKLIKDKEGLSENTDKLGLFLQKNGYIFNESFVETGEPDSITKDNWTDGVITSKDFSEPPSRVESKNYRIIRDTMMARKIKEIHNYQCQICHETPIKLKSGFYAEAHHVKPLGSPYDGPDVAENIICVCPNCHVLLDYGAIEIDKKKILGLPTRQISNKFIEFYNKVIFQY